MEEIYDKLFDKLIIQTKYMDIKWELVGEKRCLEYAFEMEYKSKLTDNLAITIKRIFYDELDTPAGYISLIEYRIYYKDEVLEYEQCKYNPNDKLTQLYKLIYDKSHKKVYLKNILENYNNDRELLKHGNKLYDGIASIVKRGDDNWIPKIIIDIDDNKEYATKYDEDKDIFYYVKELSDGTKEKHYMIYR